MVVMISEKEILGNLYEYVSSDTYRNLLILCETLPRMNDMKRKSEIIKFSKDSRSLFFRLLAITKWALTNYSTDKLDIIINEINMKSNGFIKIADELYNIAKIEIPNFIVNKSQIMAALDVLTTGNYNLMPQSYLDIPIKNNDIKIDKIYEELLEILACKNFECYKHIILHREYITLKCEKYIIDITTLNGILGPYKILNIKFLINNLIDNSFALNITKEQKQYLINFIELKLINCNEPFILLNKILNYFITNIIYEIFKQQAKCLPLLCKLTSIVDCDCIKIVYWCNFSEDKRGLTVKIIIKDDNEIDIINEPDIIPKPHYNLLNVNLKEIVYINIKTRIEIYFKTLYNYIINENIIYKKYIKFVEDQLIFKFDTCCEITFSIHEQKGNLIVESSNYKEYINLGNKELHTYSSMYEWIEFIEKYRIFCVLYKIKSQYYKRKAIFLKMSSISSTIYDDNEINKLYKKYGDLHVAIPHITCTASLNIISVCKNDDLYVYNIYFLNTTCYKNNNKAIKDLHVRSLLQYTDSFDNYCLDEQSKLPSVVDENKLIDCFELLNTCSQSAELYALLNELYRIGWDNSLEFVSITIPNPIISIKHYILAFARKNIIFRKYLVDGYVRYSDESEGYIVEINLDGKIYLSEKIKLISRIRYNLSDKIEPFEEIMKKIMAFIRLFDTVHKLIIFYDIINHVEELVLNLDEIIIKYGQELKFKMIISNNDVDDAYKIKFSSESSKINPFNTKLLDTYMNIYVIKSINSLIKIIYIIVYSCENIYALLNIQSYVCLGTNMVLNNVTPRIIIYPLSLYSCNIIYRSIFVLNISLSNNGNFVYLNDNHFKSPSIDVKSNRMISCPLYCFEYFINKISSVLGEKCFRVYDSTSFKITKKIFNYIMSPINGILYQRIILKYFESLYVLKIVSNCFHSNPTSDIFSNSFISFEINQFNIKYGFYIDNIDTQPIYVYFNVSPLQNQQQNNYNLLNCCNILTKYFNEKIINSPYLSASILQFFSLLRLKYQFYQDFVSLLQFELDSNFNDKWEIKWRHIPSNSLPFRLLPIPSCIIYQGNKCMIMVDYVYKIDQSIFITTLLLWDYNNDKIQDVHVFGSHALSSRVTEIKSIQSTIKDYIKDEVLNNPEIPLTITNLLLISFRAIKSSQNILQI